MQMEEHTVSFIIIDVSSAMKCWKCGMIHADGGTHSFFYNNRCVICYVVLGSVE